jgi:hypothetical protein
MMNLEAFDEILEFKEQKQDLYNEIKRINLPFHKVHSDFKLNC